MFSKRQTFPQRYKFDRKFLEKFISDLKDSGFDSITIKLPHNLIDDGKDEIEVREFLDRERNYPSVIFIAKNSNRQETLKLLFVNISKKAFFKDDTFPSGHSESPEIFIQSPDPARVYALFGFFKDYIKENKTRTTALPFLVSYLASSLFLILEFNSITEGKFGILASNLNINIVFDYVAIFAAFLLILKIQSQDSGLYLKEKENKFISTIKRVIMGEFRDNPIINLIITVIGGLIVLILWKFLSN